MATVLVVEDDKLSQKMLARMLANAGHDAVAAGSVDEAWEQLHRHVLVDLLILDNQLGRDWGWQFLRQVRQDPVFARLPAIVYTAHTERESIIRYVEWGVQSMHVKPYKGDVVLEELRKAERTGWMAQLIEETEQVCARLKITRNDYSGLLNASVPMIEERLLDVRRRLTSRNDPGLRASLSHIRQQGLSLGILALGSVISSVVAAIDADDLSAAAARLRMVEPLFDVMRQRAWDAMGMGDAVPRMARARGRARAAEIDAVVVDAPASLSAAFARRVAAKPVWQLGAYLERVRRTPLISPAELDETASRLLKEPVFAGLFSAVELFRRVPELSVGDAVQLVQETEGLGASYQRILDELGVAPESLAAGGKLHAAVEKQGVAKVVTWVAGARLARAARQPSPLELSPLVVHTAGVTLLSLELGRMLKLSSPHLLAAAGAVHNIGQWLFALGEPGLYGLVLALSQREDVSLGDAEGALFGTTHEDAGRRLLGVQAGESLLLQDAAALHRDPTRVQSEEHVVTVVIVHLADLLTQAALATEKAHANDVHAALRAPTNPVWGLLRARGVELPFDAPELINAMSMMAQTTTWIAEELTKGSA